jgi:hypothetical protein
MTDPSGTASTPPATRHPPLRTPSWVVPVVAAVVVVAVLLAATVGVVVWDLGNDDADGGTAAREPAPPSTVPPPTATMPPGEGDIVPTGTPEVDAALDAIAAFVEDRRGLEFLTPVTVELLDDAGFEARLLEDRDAEDDADLALAGRQLQALGLVPPGTDLVAAIDQLLGAGVLGFYDPETKELVVRGGELTPYTRQTVAHELTHALDDQHFDLDRPELDDANDESSFGFTALVEGSATQVDEAYEAALGPADRRRLLDEELSFGADIDLDGIPFVVLVQLQAPYEYGPALVDEILGRQGGDGLDQAFARPPLTSEQVLHPERYLENELAVPVAVPPAEGEIIDEGVFGELMLGILVANGTGIGDPDAVDGWGGDQYVAWGRPDGSTCVRVDVAADTEADLDELGAALADAARFLPDMTVERPSPGSVRFTSCG